MLRLTVRPYMQRLASRLASTKNPELGSHQSLDKGICIRPDTTKKTAPPY